MKIRRSRQVAILLAVFFVEFTWLYTYRDDAWKFWVNLIFIIVLHGWWLPAVWIWAITDQVYKPHGYFETYHEVQ